MEDWHEGINSQKLPSIADVCNHLLIPTVLCPWGCSEFLHSTGKLDLDVILQRYFQKTYLHVSDLNKFSKVIAARDDYIRDKIEDYDNLLLNPKWKVLPTIAFIDGNPRVFTCKDHNDGNIKFHLHCCRWKTNFPAPLSDQLCHAVMKPRTTRNMKIAYNSTGYQMVEQRVSFKGPDSINVCTVDKTDHNSILLQEAEARFYTNRTDMKALIKRNIDDGLMTDFHADGIEEFSALYSKDIDYEKYKIGSTYVPVEIAISLKEETKNRNTIGIIDNDHNEDGDLLDEYTRRFKRIWPFHIYPCQKYDQYGARMISIPYFQCNSSELLWLLSSLMLTIEPLWNTIATINEFRRSKWYGYLLTFLTKKCLHHINRKGGGFYKLLKVNELASMLNPENSLCKYIMLYLYISTIFSFTKYFSFHSLSI